MNNDTIFYNVRTGDSISKIIQRYFTMAHYLHNNVMLLLVRYKPITQA